MSTAIAVLVGLGAALVVGAPLSWLLVQLERAVKLRRSAGYRAALMLQRPAHRDDPFGLESYPWELFKVAGAMVMAVVALVADRRLLALVPLGYLFPPLVVRRYLERQAREKLRLEVRDMLQELRLLLAVRSSLGAALAVASQGNTPLRRAIAAELRSNAYGRLPEEVLGAVAQRFGSADLQDALARLESARQGTESYREALEEAAAAVAGSIAEEAEVAVEGAPTKLILPMLVSLMVPLLVVALYPPLAAVVAAITGVGNP